MKTQAVTYFFLMSTVFVSTSEDMQLFSLFSHADTTTEKIKVIGKLDEDVILPCLFENKSEVTVIHWKIQDTGYVHTYYGASDHLENQESRYKGRTSLFHSEIYKGNASLYLRRLNLLDEGIYTCYVGTKSGKVRQKMELKVGAFVTPVMKYEKRNTSSILICSILNVYPHPDIIWHMDNTPIPDSNLEEIGSLGSFYINSTVKIIEPYSSYECAIENSLLKETWKGRWKMKDDLHKIQSEQVSFSCEVADIFIPNQDFIATWSRVENGTSFIQAHFESSSQDIIINEPRLSWKKELMNQGDFSPTLKDLRITDNGVYLCNISSSKYTLLTIQTLHVASNQSTTAPIIAVPVVVSVVLVVVIAVVISMRSKVCRKETVNNVNEDELNQLHDDSDSRRTNQIPQESSKTDNVEMKVLAENSDSI